jgi:hypothetical protein
VRISRAQNNGDNHHAEDWDFLRGYTEIVAASRLRQAFGELLESLLLRNGDLGNFNQPPKLNLPITLLSCVEAARMPPIDADKYSCIFRRYRSTREGLGEVTCDEGEPDDFQKVSLRAS